MIGNLDKSFFNENNLVNLANSLLKNYGINPFHASIKDIDKAIEGHKKICLFLFDGMGEFIQNTHPKACKYIKDHKFINIYSTNPATTVAATNAIRSGKYPIETGWIGWTEYMPSVNKAFNSFSSLDAQTHKEISKEHLLKEQCSYKTIAQLIRENGYKSNQILGKVSNDCVRDEGAELLSTDKLKKFFKTVDNFFKNDGDFLYAYWPSPDYLIHTHGVNSFVVKRNLTRINRFVKKFVENNPDVLTMVIADHGLIDVSFYDIGKDNEILDCLEDNSSILLEGRTPSFRVKKGKEKDFEEIFSKKFKDCVVVMNKEEALKSEYFGSNEHNQFNEKLFGNYVCVVTKSNIIFGDSRFESLTHKAHHAGGSLEERLISLSLFNK